jgi:flagellar motor component MotA
MSGLVSALLGILSLVVVVSMFDDPLRLLDVPSFLVVILPSGLLLMVTFDAASVCKAFGAAIKNAVLDEEALRMSTLILSESARLVHATGIVGTFLGFVLMLSAMSDPSAVGPAFAVALLPVVYALVLAAFVITPLKARLNFHSSQPINGLFETNGNGEP